MFGGVTVTLVYIVEYDSYYHLPNKNSWLAPENEVPIGKGYSLFWKPSFLGGSVLGLAGGGVIIFIG